MSLAIKAGTARVGGSAGVMMSRRGLQGDPGIFSFLRDVVGGAASIAGGILPGIGGDILTKAGSLISGTNTVVGRPVSVAAVQPFVAQEASITSRVQETLGGIVDVNFPFGGEPGFGATFFGGGGSGSSSTAVAAPANGKCMGGFHLNKASYFLKNGTRIEKGTVCVKNRRRNSLNDRAASNAIKRLEGARKAIKNIQRVTIRCGKCPGKCVCP